ncbi:MAG: lysylphosphatidylglycerol synthase transmembrane domain-containing protein [Desulfatiglandaceae bacterium]
MFIGLHLWNRRTKAVIKVLLSALLLFWLLRSVHLAKILTAATKANVGYLVLAVLCQVASNLVAGFRWCLTMDILDMQESPSFFVKSFFKGTFFNQVLPGSIGGDAVRMLDLKALGYGASDAVEGVIIDRGIGLLCLLALCLFGTFVGTDLLPPAVFRGVRYLCISGIAGFGFLAILSRIPILKKIGFILFLMRISEKIWRVFSAGRKAGIIITVSVLVHILAIFSIFLISLSIGQDLGLLIFLVIFPSVVLLTVIPVSFAGWGVREGAMVGLFMSAGVDKAPILLISILYGFLVIVASFPGLFFWLIKQETKAKRQQHSDSSGSHLSGHLENSNVRLKYE